MSLSVKEKFTSICERIGFNSTRAHIKNLLQITATSRNELLDRLDNYADFIKRDAALDSIAKEALVCGKRQYEVLSVTDSSDQQSISNFFTNVKLNTAGLLKSNYPYIVSDQQQLKDADKELSIIDASQSQWGSHAIDIVVLTQVDSKLVTESANSYLNSTGSELASVGAVFSMRRESLIQQFHVAIWCKSKNILLVSVDRSYNQSQTESRDSLYSFKSKISTIMSSGVGNPLNLFDAIEPLYKENTGSITKLGLLTSDNNPVRLSLSSGEKCIKSDHYHRLGEDTGHVHGKFLVAKEWIRKLNEITQIKIAVELPGIPAMFDTAQPLTDFYIPNCSRLDDVHFVLKKLSVLS